MVSHIAEASDAMNVAPVSRSCGWLSSATGNEELAAGALFSASRRMLSACKLFLQELGLSQDCTHKVQEAVSTFRASLATMLS